MTEVVTFQRRRSLIKLTVLYSAETEACQQTETHTGLGADSDMHALVKGLQSGGPSLAKLLPALGAAASARITTTAAAPAATSSSAAVTTPLEREFMVYRWHPEDGGKPRYQSYKIDLNECDPEMPFNTSPAGVLVCSCVRDATMSLRMRTPPSSCLLAQLVDSGLVTSCQDSTDIHYSSAAAGR